MMTNIDFILNKLETENCVLRDAEEIKNRFCEKPEIFDALLFMAAAVKNNYGPAVDDKIKISINEEFDHLEIQVPMQNYDYSVNKEFFEISETAREKFGLEDQYIFLITQYEAWP
ncbi:hypothetical protein MsAg5_17780 [Methanosarcinaceae archaeon Ag5]|uniref:Uncharacterized protein n=1 Tax=Methanolapillus africanus TaxID=3028297 RepID=A0AAE4ML38_9EURY|nr:hypothetical protein [Methanosarcinaceae archaeon Ag5]